MRALPLTTGLMILAAAWLGPLPGLAAESFSAHMAMHMAVVALAAPFVALGLSGSTFDPARSMPRLCAPIPASLIELVVVWVWHMPALHDVARHVPWAFALEQVSFLLAGLLLWFAAVGGSHEQRRHRHGAGVVGLLFTSMHMTLLGALFALGPRPLYAHASLADQQLGGAIMLIVGGTAYLVGGLWLTSSLLRGWVGNRREASP